MKKWIKWFSAAKIALLALLFAGALSSCGHAYSSKHSMSEYVDSADLEKVLGDISNPTFKSIDDALTYYQVEKQSRSNDSVFFSIPEKVMRDVVSVLEKSGEPITKGSISHEFEVNKHVYMNLPDKSDQYNILTPPDIPNTEVVDTIINGKHIKVLQEETTSM